MLQHYIEDKIIYLLQNYDPSTIYILGTFLLHQILFYSLSLPLLSLDLSHSPSWLYRYKIQPNYHLSWKDSLKCLKTVIFNQLFILLPFISILYYVVIARGGLDFSPSLPKWSTIAWQVLFCIVAEEIFFYYSHRVLHSGYLYSKIHKKHHNFVAPIGMASEFAHPIEYIFSSLLPVSLGPLLLRAHLVVTWIWFAIAIVGTISHHCGYNFPWLVGGLNPQFHDLHHSSFNSNFGLLGLLDWLHNTLNKKKI